MDDNGGTIKIPTDDPRIKYLVNKLGEFVKMEGSKMPGDFHEKIAIITIAAHYFYDCIKKANRNIDLYVDIPPEEENHEDRRYGV